MMRMGFGRASVWKQKVERSWKRGERGWMCRRVMERVFVFEVLVMRVWRVLRERMGMGERVRGVRGGR